MSNRRLAAVALLLTFCVRGTDEMNAQSSTLDPTRVRWSKLELRASKLTVTADSEVEIYREPTSRAVVRWLSSSRGEPVMPRGTEVVGIHLDSQVLGKSSTLDLWVEPVSGAAFQRTQLETGKKVRHHRHRSLRFTHEGVLNSTYRASDKTVDRPYKEWPLSESFEPFPEGISRGAVVTEPSALFYFLAAGDLDQTGDAIVTYVFSKNRLMRVRLTVLGTAEIKVDYTEISGAGQKQVKGRQEVRHIRLEGTPVGGGGSDRDFEFLGLRGDVEIFLERSRRIPVQISGDIRYVGRGHVRLQRVHLN